MRALSLLTWLAFLVVLTACPHAVTPSPEPVVVITTPTEPPAQKPSAFVDHPERKDAIALVYTASVQGYVEPCGCTGDPLGGVARYAALVADARAAYRDVVVVDAGDLLFEKATDNAEVDRCQAEARTDVLVSTYARIGVVATTRGPLDDVRGAGFRDALLQKHKLTSVDHGASVVVERSGKRIAIVGVSADDPKTPLTLPAADVVVVLAQMTQKEALARGAQWSGVDVVVVGRAPEAPLLPQQAGDAVVVSAGWQSQYAGVVELYVDGRAKGRVLSLDDRQATLESRKKLLDVRLAETDKVLAEMAALPDSPKRDFFRARRETIAAERASLDQALPPMTGPHLVVSAVALRRGMGEDDVAARALNFYENSIPDLVSSCEQNVTCAEPAAGVARYVGVETCKDCHADAVETWQKALVDVDATEKDGTTTKHKAGHARAWTTLVELARDKDRSCVGCHSAGFKQEGGACTTTALVDKGLTGVQCEACHGPGSLHVLGGGDTTQIRRFVDESTCRGCHAPPHIANLEAFNYEARLPLLMGPGHQRKPKAP